MEDKNAAKRACEAYCSWQISSFVRQVIDMVDNPHRTAMRRIAHEIKYGTDDDCESNFSGTNECNCSQPYRCWQCTGYDPNPMNDDGESQHNCDCEHC